MTNLRPQKLEDYIGQDQIKDVLGTAIEAAKKLDQPLDHVLLNGPPGLGKTTLARIIAKELRWKIKTTIGGSLRSDKDTRALVLGMAPKTIIFIDEVHRVWTPAQEVLYPVLEDGVYHYKMANSVQDIELVPFSMIGATTHVGMLARPFVDRFGLQFQLEYYTKTEMEMLLTISAEKLEVKIGPEALFEVVTRCRATPRIGNRLLKRLKDYNVAKGIELTKENVSEILWKRFHIDELGLLPLDRKILRLLGRVNGPVGVEAIAVMVGEAPETIEGSVEPYLMRMGLMVRVPRGRMITEKGRRFLNGDFSQHR